MTKPEGDINLCRILFKIIYMVIYIKSKFKLNTDLWVEKFAHSKLKANFHYLIEAIFIK